MSDLQMSRVPLLAIRGLTIFPQMLVHFDVGRERSIRALQEAMNAGQMIFLVAQKDARAEEPPLDELFQMGTISRVCQILKLPGDNIRVLVQGVSRARIAAVTQSEPCIWVEVEPVPDRTSRVGADRQEAAIRRAQELFETFAELTGQVSPDIVLNAIEARDISYLADYIAQNMPLRQEEKQTVLETLAPFARLERVIAVLLHEIEIGEIEQDIQRKLHRQLGKNQREYYLREQIKTIQTELGENEDGDADDYRTRITRLQLPEEAEEKLLREAGRLERLSSSSPETAVIRTWLDTCLDLPWNKKTTDRHDLKVAERILDADHFGLPKVKERILEFLAVKQLAPDLKGQILCLVGPPGVGKTSVAQSVGRAMNRKLSRLSLGGVRDEADIRGHRKTYIGAMPGRIMTALRQAGAQNAVILMDEIDKMGHDFRGDPAAALLEVLDPEQNATFRDHYLEVPFDLSDVLFITTANTTETIPRALLDRMEIIELTSYTDEEKLQIARRHLLPRQMTRHGLTKTQLRVTDDAVREIIAGYTRESGVRRLERELSALCRKAARLIASEEKSRLTLSAGGLEEFLGVRKYKQDRARVQDEVGLVSGLAWTSVGGELLEVEVGVVQGSGKIDLTGNLGDVMKESARAALTYIRGRCEALHIDPDFYKNRDIHIHCPEGAVPKDGPSAGITMATAMVSALTGVPVRRDVAMTGEITLRGRVLPIGGLKEKTMAAFRNGVHTVIIPRDNEKDLAEIDPTVKNALQFVVAEHMDAVLGEALVFEHKPELPALPEVAFTAPPAGAPLQ